MAGVSCGSSTLVFLWEPDGAGTFGGNAIFFCLRSLRLTVFGLSFETVVGVGRGGAELVPRPPRAAIERGTAQGAGGPTRNRSGSSQLGSKDTEIRRVACTSVRLYSNANYNWVQKT